MFGTVLFNIICSQLKQHVKYTLMDKIILIEFKVIFKNDQEKRTGKKQTNRTGK